MRSPRLLLCALLLPILVSNNGCTTEPVQGGVIYKPQVLTPSRTLVAGNFEDDPESDMGLYTFSSPSTTSRKYKYRIGDRDYMSPIIGKNISRQHVIMFGQGQLKLFHTIQLNVTLVVGPGAGQYAPAFEPDTDDLRFAYMDGSMASGFNILVQSGAEGTPTALTSDASASLSYWTPSWSSDRAWVLYCRATGPTGADAQLWRVNSDGTNAEQLPITTTELPTYAIFNPAGTEVMVPGDFTSFNIADGTVGTFDHLRENTGLLADLADMGFEFVGSPLTGAVHTGDATTTVRHTFPISVLWPQSFDSRIWFEALVASNSGSHEILGVVLFTWIPGSELLVQHCAPMKISETRSEGYLWSMVRPTIVP
ncbi:hypothetical protein ACFL3H_02935 [Gemmatimonadota bacterium]